MLERLNEPIKLNGHSPYKKRVFHGNVSAEKAEEVYAALAKVFPMAPTDHCRFQHLIDSPYLKLPVQDQKESPEKTDQTPVNNS